MPDAAPPTGQRMAAAQQPPPEVPSHVSMQASEWMVALQADEANDATRQAFQAWHDAHPDHAAAWAHLLQFTEQLRAANNTPLLRQTLLAQIRKDEAAAPRGTRRNAVKLLGVAAMAGSASWWALRQTGQWDQWAADHSTGTGEQRTLTLADGTQLMLNTGTAIDVRYSAAQRLVHLRAGELLITTAAAGGTGATDPGDPATTHRPFLVQTRHGLAQALGTRFTVRLEQGHTHLGVFEGAVQITPQTQARPAAIVSAGQQTRFSHAAVDIPQALDRDGAGWADGTLIAHEMPLPQFIAQLARYRSGRLVCDASAAHLRVSGIYPIADTDRVLQALQHHLPVAVRRRTPYWVTVVHRGR